MKRRSVDRTAPGAVVDTTKPTPQVSEELQHLFTYLNEKLFSCTLDECLITPRAKKGSAGHFAPDRFIAADGKRCHEIALDPKRFNDVGKTAQTMAHEMCHAWQHQFGKPSRANYHNQEWAGAMLSIGLVPSSTGQPGGKQIGQRMSDYVAEVGPFAHAIAPLIKSGFTITWSDAVCEKSKTTGAGFRRAKSTCDDCGYSARARPGMPPICPRCHPGIKPMTEEGMN